MAEAQLVTKVTSPKRWDVPSKSIQQVLPPSMTNVWPVT
jgi:hypothetical protein